MCWTAPFDWFSVSSEIDPTVDNGVVLMTFLPTVREIDISHSLIRFGPQLLDLKCSCSGKWTILFNSIKLLSVTELASPHLGPGDKQSGCSPNAHHRELIKEMHLYLQLAGHASVLFSGCIHPQLSALLSLWGRNVKTAEKLSNPANNDALYSPEFKHLCHSPFWRCAYWWEENTICISTEYKEVPEINKHYMCLLHSNTGKGNFFTHIKTSLKY